MAEDEIKKHTMAIYNTAKNPGKWTHKLKEILIEIIIIVFAVSVSIWLHNWSDSIKEKKEEKEFLTGLKSDLQVDTANLNESAAFYAKELNGIDYFIKVANGQSLSQDSLEMYIFIFSSSTNLEANTSRYTGLKGSSKFDIIENKELLNKIIELHEVIFSHVQLLDNIFNAYNADKTEPYVFEHLQLNKDFHITNAEQVVRTSQMSFYLLSLKTLISGNIIPYHSKAIDNCIDIIKQVDEEVK